ncbi:HD-GYP domain-containing protein [Salidesulfovibrio onnuriiensis]|uniref:HD-GYP domain-containing protein n=1 Tax=Salidesulfovibrio onnuriiensis TaxID=2583823 RepID=UPI00164FAA82|nr:HD domain-containing phosphohydrolase [Salidesulfovibrio onnuriiensis]
MIMPDHKGKPAMEEGFLPIPPEHLLPNTRAGFEIYLKQGQRFVLYAKSNDQLTGEHRRRLAEMDAREVYINVSKESVYSDYIQDNMSQLLNDDEIPVDVRAETWSWSAGKLAEDVYETALPPSVLRKRVDRIKKLIEASSRFFNSPESLKELSKYISAGGDIYQHGIGTMVYALCLMQTYDADDAVLTAVCVGAMLHDIGKLQLPEELLSKDPATMTEQEFSAYSAHPNIGVRVSAVIPLMPEAIHCVLFHHERVDGNGYPSGATGEEIPLYARVVAVCNAYDGLTRSRPWRRAYTPFEALKHVRNDTGAFDQDVFMRLVKVLSDSGLT